MKSVQVAVVTLSLLVLSSACSLAKVRGNEEMESGRRGALDGLSEGGGGLAREVEPGSILTSLNLRWPLRSVQVTSFYGPRHGNSHEGIDLRARDGTPVLAAQAGQVIYAGSKIRGYGRLVVIRHNDEINTIYAHNSKLLVRKGQRVKAGQKVALSGHSGHASGPHLHFEVRKGVRPLNPIAALPPAHLAGKVMAVSAEEETDSVASSAAAPAQAVAVESADASASKVFPKKVARAHRRVAKRHSRRAHRRIATVKKRSSSGIAKSKTKSHPPNKLARVEKTEDSE